MVSSLFYMRNTGSLADRTEETVEREEMLSPEQTIVQIPFTTIKLTIK